MTYRIRVDEVYTDGSASQVAELYISGLDHHTRYRFVLDLQEHRAGSDLPGEKAGWWRTAREDVLPLA